MTTGFWDKLPKPFFALAPLYDVTDCAFREMIARRRNIEVKPQERGSTSGGPQVMFTEFVSVDGLSHEKSREKLIKLHFGYTEIQRPIVAQLWGADPEKFRIAAGIVRELGFDGIDINMGCPDKKVVAMGAGAGLIRNPNLAKEIIKATQASNLPVSVKTRVGYSQPELEDWIPELLSTGIAALTVHARTMKQMSKVPANWEMVKKVVEMRNDINGYKDIDGYKDINGYTLIIGNGDVRSIEEAKARAEEVGCDGVMIGRGIFGHYDFFTEDTNSTNGNVTNNANTDTNELIKKRLGMVVEHAELFEKYFKGLKNFRMLRKHFAEFAKGFPGAREIRAALMSAENSAEVRAIVEGWQGGGM